MAGLAVAVVEDGELSFVRTYGVADAATGAPVTPHTLFRWASVSKTAAGALAGALANDGTVDLGLPIAALNTSLRLPGGPDARVALDGFHARVTGLTHHSYDDNLGEGNNRKRILRGKR